MKGIKLDRAIDTLQRRYDYLKTKRPKEGTYSMQELVAIQKIVLYAVMCNSLLETDSANKLQRWGDEIRELYQMKQREENKRFRKKEWFQNGEGI